MSYFLHAFPYGFIASGTSDLYDSRKNFHYIDNNVWTMSEEQLHDLEYQICWEINIKYAGEVSILILRWGKLIISLK